MEDPRPARPIRIAVLLAAVALLGLAMCTRTQQPTATPSNASAMPAKTDAGAPAPDDPRFFPATKAAGPIYPQQQSK